jgi:hypothetical protein
MLFSLSRLPHNIFGQRIESLSDQLRLLIRGLAHHIPYWSSPVFKVFVIQGSCRADIDALGVALAIVLGITQVTDERLGRECQMISNGFGGTRFAAQETLGAQTSFLVKYHVKQILVVVDGWRFQWTSLLALPFFFLTLAACYLDSFGYGKKVLAHLNSGKVFIKDPVMLHRASHLADSTSDAFHFIALNKGNRWRIRIVLLSPAS